MSNTGTSILMPSDPNVLLRVAFLYVGQGSSALVFAKDGEGYQVVLVDINMDRKAGGIDVPRLVKDIVGDTGISAFINTHPHDDHLLGIEDLEEEVKIHSVCHSGHKPGKQFEDAYKQLENVIAKVKKAGGSVIELQGSNSSLPLGEAECHVLAPAEYVTDDVNDEKPETRYSRIHEQCAVLKFGKGDHWIMIAGDADRAAFENHITNYHKEHMNAYVLAAPHHGSRTFFCEKEGDEPYLEALNAIAPQYVVVSAPTQNESKYEHPHDDAMAIYEDVACEDNVFHTGEERCCFFFDINVDGTCSQPQSDDGKLAEHYGLTDEDDDGGDGGGGKSKGPFVSPASKCGDLTPRKFG